MKRFLKSSLSLLLAITIIFSSAYVGLAEVDFIGFSFGNAFKNFAIKSVAANSGTCGSGVTWALSDSGTLTISGSGSMKDFLSSSDVPWCSLSSYIYTVVIKNGVTNIARCAFENCTNITSVTIGDTVTTIGPSAFENCTNLTSIIIPDTVIRIRYDAFYNCTSLAFVSIGAGVTSIDGFAFSGCTKLTSITIPSGVISIGELAFSYCSNLTSITIGEGVENIGESAFYHCNNLASVNITNIAAWCNIEFVDSYANPLYFADKLYINWDLVTEVNIPGGVTEIPSDAFFCSNIISITIPNSVTSIGERAFRGCTNLSSITIPDSVTSIGVAAFSSCTSLASIVIPDNVTSIGAGSFSGCTSLTTVVIPDSVTSIGNSAFDCSKLKYVFYSGSESDWAGITIGSSNTYLSTASIHYNSLNHIYWNEWTIDIAPTCTEEGVKSHHCSVCDAISDMTTIPATGHNYLVQNAESVHPHIATKKCSVCDYTVREVSYNSDCFVCNSTLVELDGGCYKLVSYTGFGENIVIPSEYNGLPVSIIDVNCFKGNTTIKSVVISDGVVTMGNAVFYGCTSLERVVLPSTLTSIGNAAFYNCTNLKYVNIAEGVTTVGNSAFRGCTALETVIIPESVTNIGKQAFYGFTGTIYCFKNSVAHDYAIKNNLNFVFVEDILTTSTESSQIDYKNLIIKTTVQSCKDITEILGVSDSARIVVTASCKEGSVELLGTGAIISVYDGENHLGDYTLIVGGDTNGDSVCDALDCFEVERLANGNGALTGAYAMAADSNSDDMVDITDYQAIVNKALAS